MLPRLRKLWNEFKAYHRSETERRQLKRETRVLKKEAEDLRAQYEACLATLPEKERKRERAKFEAELAAMRKQVAEEQGQKTE